MKPCHNFAACGTLFGSIAMTAGMTKCWLIQSRAKTGSRKLAIANPIAGSQRDFFCSIALGGWLSLSLVAWPKKGL
ncbi:Uncharacterised protein [Vibrio cholerae]|nr:Uncharacterised protein [Vibrio cholerae]